ncbi:hypothetical protein BZG36_02532 [Bifiguratus adelaidae]|uniref:ABC transporter domain-containing protein n=1 Tax=Bifiguratus adelaidae TaxID=1938954 RepID=A0A261Y2H9_9FUNG|nr:hypothetical protein BZG36_02532 [Bifiguratus adelaidae]
MDPYSIQREPDPYWPNSYQWEDEDTDTESPSADANLRRARTAPSERTSVASTAVNSDEDRMARSNELLRRSSTTGAFGERRGNAVNYEAALSEYEGLARELTTQSRRYSVSQGEKGGQADFDLGSWLKGVKQANEDAAIKPRSMGLIWKNLTVKGLGADAQTVSTNLSWILEFVQFWKWGRHRGTDFTILHNITGFCKEGEMLLVLGRPGAGCTTLLRVLADMRASYTEITGEVSYGGIDSKEFGKHYKGEVCYNEEEDINYPTLTAKETLMFALKCKTPGKRLPDETKREFKNKVLFLLGNMLGLTKQMNTMVGNAFIRGLSGGERKRLSIAEQMTTRSTINCWDCSTRGLDASSALDYVRSLRIMTEILHKTTVATLYQASDSIYNIFDKVMLLDQGRCLYFGPVDRAQPYFEEMGFVKPSRKSIPDFLTGLCNLLERQVKEGMEEKVPIAASQFEERYLQSSLYKEMMGELQSYEDRLSRERPDQLFREAVSEAHQKHAPKRSIYTATYWQQVKALTTRQFQLIYGDKGALISRYGGVISKGLILSSCFYMMPQTANGAFSRGEKHKSYALYHPSAFYIAQVIADFPLAVLQVILFQLCTYFMFGLDLTAGKYFTFMVVLIMTNMCMNGFFRFWGSISPNFFTASQVSGTFLVALLLYSGYQIPYTKMHPWLFWIYWINPLAYGFKVLISNEFTGQDLSCLGPGSSIPSGPGYTNPQYQTCSVKGGQPGTGFVLGDDYLAAQYGYFTWQLWIDFAAVCGFFLLFTVATALSMEYVDLVKEGSLTKVYLPGKAPPPMDESEVAKNAEQANENVEAVADGTVFSWQHVNYEVPVKGGQRQLLNDVSGIVKPGHLTALMGSSGAGKTTLLDVLAKRKTIGKVTGDIYMNGETLNVDFERITGYCEQMDVHSPYSTVREALQFAAYLKQPADVSKAEKNAYVETILKLMEMERIGDALVGDLESGKGISVEERKRLTIAVELVGKPKLLFLDEPTSGLDAQSSYNIVRFIRKLADAGWPVRGGKTAYYGEIGKDSATMINYFERNGGPKCSPEANPAEYILEVVGAGTAGKATKDWAEVWERSPEAQNLSRELDEISQNIDPHQRRKADSYTQPFWSQFWLVHKRMQISWWRSPTYNMGRFFNVCFVALISGFSFWKLKDSSSDLQNRLFAVFTTLIMSNSLIILAQPRYMAERQWFRREYAGKYYSWAPFALSCILVELPYIIVLAAFFLFCFYWTAEMNQGSDRIGFFYIHFVFFVFYAVSLGFLIAAFSTTQTMAAVLNPFFTSILILFAGIVQPPSLMPAFWRSWMYWLDPYHYVIEGLVVNEMEGVKINCSPEDLLSINAPSGQTCHQYMVNYLSHPPGYLANPNGTGTCQFCQYSYGQDYYETTIGWSFSNRWRDFGIVIAFWAFNIMAFTFFVWLFRRPKR